MCPELCASLFWFLVCFFPNFFKFTVELACSVLLVISILLGLCPIQYATDCRLMLKNYQNSTKPNFILRVSYCLEIPSPRKRSEWVCEWVSEWATGSVRKRVTGCVYACVWLNIYCTGMVLWDIKDVSDKHAMILVAIALILPFQLISHYQ